MKPSPVFFDDRRGYFVKLLYIKIFNRQPPALGLEKTRKRGVAKEYVKSYRGKGN